MRWILKRLDILHTLGYSESGFYPPGSKSVALQLGVHLILLYFIRISLLSAETFLNVITRERKNYTPLAHSPRGDIRSTNTVMLLRSSCNRRLQGRKCSLSSPYNTVSLYFQSTSHDTHEVGQTVISSAPQTSS